MPMVANSTRRTNLVVQCYRALHHALHEQPHASFIVHAFSMNGAWTNARLQLLDDLLENNLMSKCRCLINDSCPVGVTLPRINSSTHQTTNDLNDANANNRIPMLLSTSRAYMSNIIGKVSYHNPRLAQIFAAGVLTSIAIECVHQRQQVLDMFDGTLNQMILHTFPQKSRAKQLFLYSDGDNLISFKAVESAMKQIQENSPRTAMSSYKFKGSPHCMHYRKNKDLYCKILGNFLKNSLGALVSGERAQAATAATAKL